MWPLPLPVAFCQTSSYPHSFYIFQLNIWWALRVFQVVKWAQDKMSLRPLIILSHPFFSITIEVKQTVKFLDLTSVLFFERLSLLQTLLKVKTHFKPKISCKVLRYLLQKYVLFNLWNAQNNFNKIVFKYHFQLRRALWVS